MKNEKNVEKTHEFTAKVVVNGDYSIKITPYRHRTGPRYNQLYETAHGMIKETSSDVIFKLQFTKGDGKTTILRGLKAEVDAMAKFVKQTNLVSEWQ